MFLDIDFLEIHKNLKKMHADFEKQINTLFIEVRALRNIAQTR